MLLIRQICRLHCYIFQRTLFSIIRKECIAVTNRMNYVPESIILYLLPEIPYFSAEETENFSQKIKHYPEQSRFYQFIFRDMSFKKY